MSQQISQFVLAPADRIVVPKSGLRIIQHHAIYYGRDVNGADLIIENAFGFGVRLVTAESFFKKYNSVTRIEKFAGNALQRGAALKRAWSQLGKSYDVTHYNCEGFCNYVQYGVIKSNQVDGVFEGLKFAAGAALIIGLFNLFTND